MPHVIVLFFPCAVGVKVLSVPPAMWRYDLGKDLAYRWCSAVNAFLAGIAVKTPRFQGRFAALGIVPLQFPHLAAQVAKEAMRMGLVGVQVCGVWRVLVSL